MVKKPSGDTFSIIQKTKGTLPRVPFVAIKNAVVGEKSYISLGIIGSTRMRTLNRTYRNKDKTTNVLAFQSEKNSGDIFIDPNRSQREASKFDHTIPEHLGYLFIHALLHLKGFAHGSRMNSEEKKYMRKFFPHV
ncbi:rRNA maturation RNase YbeY [Candidatus Wolfebacteria bacterium]|nr:MAG: rRNA maturation RNase YbeY [Candidatus Wolfebacteria bacterium]